MMTPSTTPRPASWRLTLLSCCLAVLTASSASVATEADGDTETVVAAPREVDVHLSGESPPESTELQSRLTRILTDVEWFDDVEVQVRNGVVFLKGVAESEDRREWAGAFASRLDGVDAVVNRITVSKKIDYAETFGIVVASLRSMWEDFIAHSPLILAGVLALIATAVFDKIAQAIANRLTRRSRMGTSMRDLISQLVTISVWVTGLMVAAMITFPGMTPSKTLAVLGLGSVAVGFAFKDIFENFFAGILILWKYPFDKGDFIECGEIKGKIENISIRMSMIRQVDGQLVVVPNAMLFKNAVDVLTDQSVRRTTIVCGVAYDSDLDQSRDVIRRAVETCRTVRHGDHPIEIFAQELADSSINFEVTWWTGATPKEIRESRDEVVRAVKKALDEAGIEIPFPQRTLWLPDPIETRLSRGTVESERVATADGNGKVAAEV